MSEQNSSTETPETTAPEAEVVVEPNRLQKFVIKHPRTAKVVAITGATLAVVGTAVTANTMRKNRHHLDAAADHVLEAGHELSESVSPSPETDA